MPKKYEISTEAQVLLKLLRIALGTEPMAADGRPVEPFPQAINWREVIQLSYKQKVSSLAVDGLKASGYDPREGKSGLQLEELNAVLTPWFDDVKNTEESYAYYFTVLSTLCQIFSANGLKPIILKGYGLSLYYPIPSHRTVGDIDIFLIDESGNPAAEKGDALMEKLLGIKISSEKVDLHSQFLFKGISIENHYSLVGQVWEYSNRDAFEMLLENEIKKDLIERGGLYFPSASFNELFLLKHMHTHFKQQRMTLRQLCDYAVFLSEYGNEIDWGTIKIFCAENSFINYTAGIHKIGRDFLGFKGMPCLFPNTEDWSDNLVNEIFYFGHERNTLWEKLMVYAKNTWHCKHFHNKHWIILTSKYVIGSISRIVRTFNDKK